MTLRPFVSGIAVVLLAAVGQADVTVSRTVKSGGFGGMGASETRSVEYYRGANQRADRTVTFAGGLMNKMAGGERREIVRVGDDKMWTLNLKKKTYQEQKISAMAADMKKSLSSSPGAENGKTPAPTSKITKAEVTVEPTSQKKTLNGFSCTLTRVRMRLEAENIKTKATSAMRLEMDQWTTPETAALKTLREHETAYSQAYLKKMGWDASPQDMQKMGYAALMTTLGVEEKALEAKMKELSKEMAKIKGVPVVSDVKWFMETGAGAPPAPPQKVASGGEWDDEPVDVKSGPVGILGGLAGKMAKKKMASAAASRPAAGETPTISSTTEIREIKTDALPKDTFEIPVGFKLTK